jgi:hypothetical protein
MTKPRKSNVPPSATVYYGTVILYVIGIAKRFSQIWNCFNVRAINKPELTVHGTLMKTVLVAMPSR